MFQTARRLHGRFAAFGATLVALHSQLIFALPRNGQMRELVFNALSHDLSKAGRTSVVNQSSISMTDRTMVLARLANDVKLTRLRAGVRSVSFGFVQNAVKIGNSFTPVLSAPPFFGWVRDSKRVR
jgi:hypothetical protein